MIVDFPHELPLLGVGVDLAAPSRLGRSVQNPRFVERVFSPSEIEAYVTPGLDTTALAEAFALKEAFLKALGTGWTDGIAFHEVEGPPRALGSLRLSGRAATLASAAGVTVISAAVRTAGDVSLAVVMLFGKGHGR